MRLGRTVGHGAGAEHALTLTDMEFDPAPLSDLATDLDIDTTREIIHSFLGEAPILLRNAAEALRTADVAGFRRAVHTLKSTAAHVGAMRLSEACRNLEVAAWKGDLPADPDAVQELQRLFDAVRGRLAGWNG